MPLFRKRPVTIEAIKWRGDNIEQMKGFMGVFSVNIGRIVVRTIERDMKAEVGDWIIKGVKGEFYLCKPDIFEQTYEAV